MRDRFYLEQVVLAEHLVDGAEAEVRGVGEAAQGQQVGVAVAQPGHLEKFLKMCFNFKIRLNLGTLSITWPFRISAKKPGNIYI